MQRITDQKTTLGALVDGPGFLPRAARATFDTPDATQVELPLARRETLILDERALSTDPRVRARPMRLPPRLDATRLMASARAPALQSPDTLIQSFDWPDRTPTVVLPRASLPQARSVWSKIVEELVASLRR